MRDVKAPSQAVNAGSAVLPARRTAALAVSAALISLLVLAGSASATVTGHTYEKTFTGSGTNTLGLPVGIGVDNSSTASAGSVYVGDLLSARVEKFDSSGNFQLMFGKGVNETSGGDVCPRPAFPADVCQAGTEGSGPAQFSYPKYIVVDSTGGASAGDVYVLDPISQIVQKFNPAGELITSWGGPPNGPAGGQLTGEGVPVLGKWTDAQGIAIDSGGNLNVMNRTSSPGGQRIYVFSQSGTFTRTVLTSQRPNTSGLGVDSFGNFLDGAASGQGGEYKYRGTDGGTIAGDFNNGGGIVGGTVAGRAVDVSPDPRRTDDYYMVTSGTVNQYHWLQPNKWLQADGTYCFAGNGGCHPTSTFGPPNLGFATGVAVANSGYVYVSDAAFEGVVVFEPKITPDLTNLHATNVDVNVGTKEGSATLNGNVGLAGGPNVTECMFEYGRSASSYEEPPVPCVPAASPGTPYTTETAVHADLTGLLPNTTYHYRISAANANGVQKSEAAAFTTPGPPGIESFVVSNLTSSSADFKAKINPHGDETTYVFHYGPNQLYGTNAPVPAGTLAAGFESQEVTTHVNLEDTSYHFQVEAVNKYGSSVSEDQTFSFHPEQCPNQTVRQQTGSAYLPDCRAYELVSPEDSGSAFIFSGGPQRPYASNPPRFAFTADFGDFPEVEGNPINTTGDLYVATRGPEGWKTKFTGVPATLSGCAGGRPKFAGAGLASTVQNDVKADKGLNRVVDWQLGNPTECVWDTIGLSFRFTDKNEKTHASMAPYVWDTSDGSFVDKLPTSVADIPATEEHSGSEEDFECFQQESVSADTNCSNAVELSGDLTHFVFSTQSDIYNGGPEALNHAPGSAYDNDTVNNTLSLISLKPGNNEPISQEPAPNGGSTEVIQFPFVSEDGSHILMGTLKNPECRQREYPAYFEQQCPQVSNPTHLFMRVNDAVTYEIAPVPVEYVDATPDGHKIYFTTTQALTGEDTDASKDLYMWSDLGVTPGLTVLSKGTTGGNGNSCAAGWTSACNIETYKDTQIAGSASNRGGLSPEWFTPPAYGFQPAPGNTGMKGFTDNAVAIESGDIVYYSPENLDGAGISRAVNVYEYRNGTSQLVTTLEDDPYCITSDSKEQVDNRPEHCSDGPLGRLQVSPDGRYIAFITTTQLTSYDNEGYAEMYRYDANTRNIVCASCRPDGQPPTSDVLGSYTGRFLTDDGRVFLTTNEEIDPRDTNTSKDIFSGKTLGADIYEYSGGVPKLISTGTGQQAGGLGLTAEAWPGLLGASADGTDVFFLWTEPLTGQDTNGLNNYRVYDARTGGGFLFNPPAPPCAAADECHDVPSQPAGDLASGTGAPLGSGGNAQTTTKKKKHKKKHKKKARHRKHRRHHGRARHKNSGGQR